MSDRNDDPDAAIDRLEAALERIARHTTPPAPSDRNAEIAAGLDRLIERLRAAVAPGPE